MSSIRERISQGNGSTQNTAEQLRIYSACVFAPDDVIEIRRLKPPSSTWVRAGDLHALVGVLVADNERGLNIYCGANPRKAAGGTTAADVAIARCLFLDFDNVAWADVQAKIAAMPEPTLTLNSGHGIHCYWRLTEPLVDLGAWSGWQQDLIRLCKSDPSVHDPPRIMRLPGFTNHKEPAAMAELIEADPSRVYELCDLHDLIPHIEDEPAKPQTPVNGNGKAHGLDVLARATAYLSRIPGAIEGDHGDDCTFRVCCQLTNDFSLSVDEALPLLQAWNKTCTPPWSDRDLRAKLEHAVKYAKGTPGSKASAMIQGSPKQTLRHTLPEVTASPLVVELGSIQPKRPEWLWDHRIPLGSVSLVAGDPGLGKSTVTLAMAAAVSRGGQWPDGSTCEQGTVILMSAEDSIEYTIVPRLLAADADMSRVVALQGVQYCGPEVENREKPITLEDIQIFQQTIQERPGTRLVIIDPVSAFLGDCDSHVNTDVRRVMAPLARLADECGVAVVCVSHLNKSGAGPAIYRAMGSLAFVAASRAAWIVCQDKEDEDRRLMLPCKMNLGRMPDGLAFRVAPSPYDPEVGIIHWEAGTVTMKADDAVNQDVGQDRSERDGCKDWLMDVLRPGKILAREVKALARSAGFSDRTLRRAKEETGVVFFRTGFGKDCLTYWKLPDTTDDHTCPSQIDGQVCVEVAKCDELAKCDEAITHGHTSTLDHLYEMGQV